MIYTKYLFTPYDFAIFILFADLTNSRKNKVLKDFFDNHNADIVYPFREDFMRFQRSVGDLLIKFELNYNDFDEAEMIIHEVNGFSTEQTSDPDYYGAYFKQIKLRLLYSVDFCKIKMSTLLSDFGYKRRSPQLVTRMKRAVKRLDLLPQTRGYEICDLGTVNLNTMIMFRLSNNTNNLETSD